MAAITTRSGKGSALTSAEVDANFTNLNTDKAEKSVTLSAGTGLTGGGNLSANRSFALANTSVSAGNYGGNNSIPIFSVDAQGRLTAASTVTPSGTWGISVSGSAAKLTTARTIGGVSFDGSANINLPGVNTTGNQSTTGAAARVSMPDTRDVNDQPQNKVGRSITADFKNSTAVNNPPVSAGGVHSHIITVAGWSTEEGSGGWPTQLSVGTQGMAYRQAISATTWGSWTQFVTNNGGTWGINVSGNANTSGGFAGSWGNWADYGDARNRAIYSLAWRNYGNNHVIFDASAGVSPSGTAVNNTNSTIPWSGTYPTLMGWNGAATYGVRVDSSRIADNATAAITQGKSDASGLIATTDFAKGLFNSPTTAGALNWNDNSNTIPGVGPTLLLGSHANGPGPASYFHPLNIAYANTNGQGNVTQLAISYSVDANELYMRGRYDGAWSGWTRFLNSGNYNQYAVPLSGATMSGVLATRTTNAVFTSANDSTLSVRGDTSFGAVMSFHRAGAFAVNFGLDTDNIMKLGGWAVGGVPHYWDMSGNAWATNSLRSSNFYNQNNTSYSWSFNDSNRFTTPYGYIDIGPKNAGTCHIYTDSPSFYFNQALFSPTYYDSVDTSYYVNPNGNSRLFQIHVGVGASYADIYLSDDEAQDGQNRIHSNGGVIGFLRGGGAAWNFYVETTGSGNAYLLGSLSQGSDERLKKDWESLPTDFIERLATVKHGTYTRIESGVRSAGASANDIKEILPEAVGENKDGYLTLDYAGTALVSSIELAARVVELERRLAELEAKLN